MLCWGRRNSYISGSYKSWVAGNCLRRILINKRDRQTHIHPENALLAFVVKKQHQHWYGDPTHCRNSIRIKLQYETDLA